MCLAFVQYRQVFLFFSSAKPSLHKIGEEGEHFNPLDCHFLHPAGILYLSLRFFVFLFFFISTFPFKRNFKKQFEISPYQGVNNKYSKYSFFQGFLFHNWELRSGLSI